MTPIPRPYLLPTSNNPSLHHPTGNDFELYITLDYPTPLPLSPLHDRLEERSKHTSDQRTRRCDGERSRRTRRKRRRRRARRRAGGRSGGRSSGGRGGGGGRCGLCDAGDGGHG